MEDKKEITSENNDNRQTVIPRHRLISYLALVVIGLSASFFLVEFVLRGYYYAANKQLLSLKPARTTLKYYDNEVIGHAFKPDQQGWFVTHTNEYFTHVEINSHGWPDVEHMYDKPDNTYRIVVLGDSFVENLQVPLEQRFFRQLERKLNESNYAEQFGKQTVEVIALGRGNTGTNQQYLMLKEFGLQYQPDLVIHAFLTANDIKNNSPELENDPYLPFFELQDGKLVQLPHKNRNDRKFASIKEPIKNLRLVEILLQIRQKYQENRNSKLSDYPIEYHVYDSECNEQYINAWEITKNLLLESKRITEESGARYLLITLANNEQVNNDVWDELLKTYPEMESADLQRNKPDVMIENFCNENGIECHFMLPHFEEYVLDTPEAPTHYRYDGHWNEVGTNLAAEFLFHTLNRD